MTSTMSLIPVIGRRADRFAQQNVVAERRDDRGCYRRTDAQPQRAGDDDEDRDVLEGELRQADDARRRP